MPTINLKQEVYDELLEVMGLELKKKLEESPQEALCALVKTKYGVEFNEMISKFIRDYKEK